MASRSLIILRLFILQPRSSKLFCLTVAFLFCQRMVRGLYLAAISQPSCLLLFAVFATP